MKVFVYLSASDRTCAPVNYKKHLSKNHISINQSGFSLIELVITIVVLGIALTALSSSLFSGVSQNANPLWQTKATQLSQAYFDEILSMKYQDDSPLGGGSAISGTCSINGPETGENDRSDFDDVDDYDGLIETAHFLDSTIPSTYGGYNVNIQVTCEDHLGAASNISKRIQLTILSSTNQSLVFSAFRADL
jgi:MSHA pilin protein MshD